MSNPNKQKHDIERLRKEIADLHKTVRKQQQHINNAFPATLPQQSSFASSNLPFYHHNHIPSQNSVPTHHGSKIATHHQHYNVHPSQQLPTAVTTTPVAVPVPAVASCALCQVSQPLRIPLS
jgi:hypothetical protein